MWLFELELVICLSKLYFAFQGLTGTLLDNVFRYFAVAIWRKVGEKMTKFSLYLGFDGDLLDFMMLFCRSCGDLCKLISSVWPELALKITSWSYLVQDLLVASKEEYHLATDLNHRRAESLAEKKSSVRDTLSWDKKLEFESVCLYPYENVLSSCDLPESFYRDFGPIKGLSWSTRSCRTTDGEVRWARKDLLYWGSEPDWLRSQIYINFFWRLTTKAIIDEHLTRYPSYFKRCNCRRMEPFEIKRKLSFKKCPL